MIGIRLGEGPPLDFDRELMAEPKTKFWVDQASLRRTATATNAAAMNSRLAATICWSRPACAKGLDPVGQPAEMQLPRLAGEQRQERPHRTDRPSSAKAPNSISASTEKRVAPAGRRHEAIQPCHVARQTARRLLRHARAQAQCKPCSSNGISTLNANCGAANRAADLGGDGGIAVREARPSDSSRAATIERNGPGFQGLLAVRKLLLPALLIRGGGF